MPELPEVETIVRTLAPKLRGRIISSIEHLRDDMVSPKGFDLRAALIARTVTDITRRAKRIIFTLDDGNSFYIHLGMSGRLTLEPLDAPIEKHTHLIARLTPGQSVPAPARISATTDLRLRDPRRFGGIFWLGKSDSISDSSLGPEPLTLHTSILRERLSQTKRAIKNALLDQQLIAGLGNIYVDESLFIAKIHPLKRADRLHNDEVERLNRAIKQTLRKAINHRGSTLRDYTDSNGNAGGFQKLHRVYDREGEACVNCKTPIERIVIGGRSTHFCPRCQVASRVAWRVASKKKRRLAR